MWGFREEMEAGLVLCPVLGWGCGRTRWVLAQIHLTSVSLHRYLGHSAPSTILFMHSHKDTHTQTYNAHMHTNATHTHTHTHTRCSYYLLSILLPLPICKYLNYLVPLHINSVLVLPVHSLLFLLILQCIYSFLLMASHFRADS
jgi:hypothetical protein